MHDFWKNLDVIWRNMLVHQLLSISPCFVIRSCRKSLYGMILLFSVYTASLICVARTSFDVKRQIGRYFWLVLKSRKNFSHLSHEWTVGVRNPNFIKSEFRKSKVHIWHKYYKHTMYIFTHFYLTYLHRVSNTFSGVNNMIVWQTKYILTTYDSKETNL